MQNNYSLANCMNHLYRLQPSLSFMLICFSHIFSPTWIVPCLQRLSYSLFLLHLTFFSYNGILDFYETSLHVLDLVLHLHFPTASHQLHNPMLINSELNPVVVRGAYFQESVFRIAAYVGFHLLFTTCVPCSIQTMKSISLW